MLIPDARGWKRATTKLEQVEAGAKLQALLDDAMLTQAEAADLIGVDHRTMRRYVLGERGYPYCVWFVLLVLQEKKAAERPNPVSLSESTREDLERELDKWRDEQSKCARASRAFARAAEHLRALCDEFARRGEQPHGRRAIPAQTHPISEPEEEDDSTQRAEADSVSESG